MNTGKHFPEDLPMWGDKKNSVPEVRRFLDRLGAPDRQLKIVHVAGTNGKGSVCAYLTQAFLDAGLRTGTFISPHLVDIRERILIDNVPVSPERFQAAAERVKLLGEQWEKEGGSFPAYFEFLFYMAMLIFQEADVDVVMLETGLGGRLDATNSCAPIMTVITSISLDHMQYLGDTVEKIAAEKAGIIKPGVPIVYDARRAGTAEVIRRQAELMGAPALAVKDIEESFSFLPARYMRENATLAKRVFELLGKQPELWQGRKDSAQLFEDSVRRTHWAGRMDEIYPNVFLDGGHNEDGVRAMTEAARGICEARGKKPVLLTSAVSDKDLRHVVAAFSEALQPVRVYVAPLDSYRAADASELARLYRADGVADVREYASVAEAWRRARAERSEDEILFGAGSLYLVGEILAAERSQK